MPRFMHRHGADVASGRISFGAKHRNQPIDDDGRFWCPPECVASALRAGHTMLEEDDGPSTPSAPDASTIRGYSRNQAWAAVKEADPEDYLGLSYRDTTGGEMINALLTHYNLEEV